MFDIEVSRMLNKSEVGNFVFEPVGNICNVQIFDNLKMDTVGELVGNLAHIIAQLPLSKPFETTSTKIVSPYDISEDTFVFDVAINCGGGDFVAYKAIASMFALAKSRGAIIRTHNIGYAGSAASMLAIQGTPGYRIMSENAYNMIHYGSDGSLNTTRKDEMKIAMENKKKEHIQIFSAYEKYTKITKEELEKYETKEGTGRLYANQCLKKHLCDWILTSNGQLIGRKR